MVRHTPFHLHSLLEEFCIFVCGFEIRKKLQDEVLLLQLELEN